jgi:hypothetical protein
MSIEVAQLSGERVKIPAEALERFRSTMRGPVLTPADPGYDEARVIWSKDYRQRRPAVIARCSGTADVVDAVDFAREHGLLTAVRGGGHGIQGFATVDDGIQINLMTMNSVLVDPVARIARVQGGATLGDVDRETTLHDLAVPTGVAPTTGMGGLTLGGGVGWLHRKYGLTLDNLRSVEIVTADGRVLRASADDHADLFWAVRGGGGNFGVVTEFEFDAHPVPGELALTLAAYPLEDMASVARQWRDWTETLPDEVTTRLITLAPIDHPNMEPELVGRDLVIVGAMHSGPAEEGAPFVDPARNFGRPLLDMSGRMDFRTIQTKFDLMVYGEWSGYWKSVYLDHLNDDVLDVAVEWSGKRPIGTSVVQLMHLGGAVGRVGAGDTAFGDRSAPYLLSAETAWQDSDIYRQKCIDWAQGIIGDTEELGCTHGTYLNFNGETDAGTRGAQFGENMARLREIKARYDPTNLFRCNHNISPAEEVAQ